MPNSGKIPFSRKPGLRWRLAELADVGVISQIAGEIHPDFPERSEIFAERIALVPDGCFALAHERGITGYGLSHPWLLHRVPQLDTFLKGLPPAPDCLFIHDVALLPGARGVGACAAIVELFCRVAERHQLGHLALVSVHDTSPLWRRLGFHVVQDPHQVPEMNSYGDKARYMLRRLDDLTLPATSGSLPEPGRPKQ